MGDNILTAPLTALKQLGEQSNMSIQSLGSGMANIASKGIDKVVQSVPPLPGMPSGGKSLSLSPSSLTNVLARVEDVLPSGGLKLSQKMGKPASSAAPEVPNGTAAKATVTAQRNSQIIEMRGM